MNRPRSIAPAPPPPPPEGAVERVDRKVFANDYTDVALLGKAVTRSRGWPVAGAALHGANGAAFGLAFDVVRRRTSIPPRRLALGLALGEHPRSFRSARSSIAITRPAANLASSGCSSGAFAQATFRHALFGLVLGRLAA